MTALTSMTESFDSASAVPGARRANGAAESTPPNPEVVAVAKYRRLLGAEKQRILEVKPVAALLVDLDVTKTHSRPHVSDDNPFSEAQFKTLKYRPDFPPRFGSIEDARAHCQKFFQWYNTAHRHSGIGDMTPHTVHYGEAIALNLQRAATLNTAFIAHRSASRASHPSLPHCPPPPGSIHRTRSPHHPPSAPFAL